MIPKYFYIIYVDFTVSLFYFKRLPYPKALDRYNITNNLHSLKVFCQNVCTIKSQYIIPIGSLDSKQKMWENNGNRKSMICAINMRKQIMNILHFIDIPTKIINKKLC
jgi:hypothetical protein